ncbi:MAG: hypothetical protein AB7V45_15390 [Candidatus Krumholzibacteriia bacterium]
MAHILITPELMADPDLCARLRTWGMTAGRWAQDASGAAQPTIWDCDAVLVAAGDPVPGVGDGDQAAPVVVLGEGPTSRGAHAVLRGSGPAGSFLLGALQTAVAESASRRATAGARSILETDPLLVIGHELRTPLTAVKTALEALGGSAWSGTGDVGSPGPEDRILGIALRNVRRMETSLDWVQSLAFRIREAAEASAPRPIPPTELAELLAEVAPVSVNGSDEAFLVAHPGLVNTAVRGLARTLRGAVPHRPVRIHLTRCDRSPDVLVLEIAAVDGADPAGTEIARDGSARSGELADDLRRAACAAAGGGVLSELGAVVEAVVEPGGASLLRLILPAARPQAVS